MWRIIAGAESWGSGYSRRGHILQSWGVWGMKWPTLWSGPRAVVCRFRAEFLGQTETRHFAHHLPYFDASVHFLKKNESGVEALLFRETVGTPACIVEAQMQGDMIKISTEQCKNDQRSEHVDEYDQKM